LGHEIEVSKKKIHFSQKVSVAIIIKILLGNKNCDKLFSHMNKKSTKNEMKKI